MTTNVIRLAGAIGLTVILARLYVLARSATCAVCLRPFAVFCDGHDDRCYRHRVPRRRRGSTR